MLTQELINERLEYKDGDLYWRVNRGGKAKVGTKAGAYSTSDGYIYVSIDGKKQAAPRLIFLLLKGYLPEEIDHIDRNRTNNKIDNLREANHAQNMFNCSKHISNTSGIKGVSWCDTTKSWQARIRVGKGNRISVGYFKSLDKAEQAMKIARLQYHGVYAHSA